MSGSIVREALVRVTVWGLQDRLADRLPGRARRPVPARTRPGGGEAARRRDADRRRRDDERRDRGTRPRRPAAPVAGLLVLAELVVYILVAAWIGVGWTILATLATSAVGIALLGAPGHAGADRPAGARTVAAPGRPGTRRRRAGRRRRAADGPAGLPRRPRRPAVPAAGHARAGARAAHPQVVVAGRRWPAPTGPGGERADGRPVDAPHRSVRTPPLVIEGEIVRGPDGRPLG